MKPRARSKIVMVFGVFDRLHPGHLSFLKQARNHGEKLIVVVARDNAVRELKNKNSSQNEKERRAILRKIPDVSKVVLGDKKQGSYGVIKKYKPDMICFGYDQRRFEVDLYKYLRKNLLFKVKPFRLRPYKHHKYHTSKLNVRG